MKFIFKPLTSDHIKLLAHWLQTPHVKEFWQETEDLGELREKFLSLPAARGVSPYIAELDGTDIGYVQRYEACKVGGGWWPNSKPGTFGIDQFIGVAEMINRGIGTELLRQFTNETFKNLQVREIIVDPEPANARAIRAYEKAGFVAMGEITTPGGAALLMKLVRPT